MAPIDSLRSMGTALSALSRCLAESEYALSELDKSMCPLIQDM